MKPTKILEAEIALKNQQRNFLTASLPEHAGAEEKFAGRFKALYHQETIEWE
ncbi:MAG: hypothetical protein ABSC25_14890 [Roseiarcus sp.]